ncbi:phage portal protein, HK97 family [Methylobacterium phyllostachyos]|uniref:Phage portal protein, HK97 family n=1 Tax=Methylobacterium phyllostachyos TaxID=582672 RepID=A0A1H0CEW6_9HYPH|nr:phage portal protein [Methylobacterium phyllostachyos]SDN56331.1 phage portal protein, HK97 family [Methylobacterium phyllostachyos]
MSTLLERLARVARRTPHGAAPATKAAPAFALYAEGRACWTPRDPAALAQAGYQRNPVVHRAVRLVAESAASLPLIATGPDAARGGDLLALLARPNPRESGTQLLETVFADLLLAGTAYLEAVTLDGRVAALQALRPGRMRMLPGPDGWPAAYIYTAGGQSRRFDLPAPGAPEVAPILALSLFHPEDEAGGFAPIAAAAAALDIHNAASAWNKALLDNAARPSGALVFAGATLSEPQFDRLKAELEANYQGAANAGRPLLLEGGLDWKPLALSPRDMDFVEAKNAAAREIALAFGVPPLLLGLPGDNTHANYAEANRALYRQTLIPLATRTAKALGVWLEPAFGSVDLEPDLDRIEALSAERESLWRRVQAAEFLSISEKRAAVGYPPEMPREGEA